jgi:hypothetical protein
MRPQNTPVVQASVPLTDRLDFRIATLFFITFFLAFVGLWVMDVFAAYQERAVAESTMPPESVPVVIDPKIQSDLARVLTLQSAPNVENLNDPFIDRANLSATTAAGAAGPGPVTSTTVGGTQGTAPSAVTAGGSGSTGGSPGSSSAGSATAAEITALEATRLRYNNWIERARAGYVEDIDPRVFAIEDLLPVGIVDGGSGQQEVLFYSETAARTFSFPVGTMFHDGWLTELRPEGVVFSYGDARRTVRMRSWARALRAG